MNRITFCAAGAKYDAVIGDGALGLLAETTLRIVPGSHIAVVADENTAALFGAEVSSLLSKAGFCVSTVKLAGGEPQKTLAGMEHIYRHLYEASMTRKDGIIALGGGVVGDMAGFAAATYLRGLPLISVPTTLVAQTDSAYGGKTGVDFDDGKNYIGCFNSPAAVICDTRFLSYLPVSELRSGMGEVIKYGAIADEKILDEVIRTRGVSPELVSACVDIKRRYVEADPFDSGERHVLNFGHTVGHAYEAASGYAIPHGQAVAYGMLAAVHIGISLGVTAPSVYDRVETACSSVGLDVDWRRSLTDACSLIARDKKFDGSTIDMVLLKNIAAPIRVPLTPRRVVEQLR